MPVWHVYILRCADGTFYTGIATDVERRVHEHNTHDRLGARYTRARRPVELLYSESHETRSHAAQREAQIKRMSRVEKACLLATTTLAK